MMGGCFSDFRNRKVHDLQSMRPSWTYTVKLKDEFKNDEIGSYTEGIRKINQSTVERSGKNINPVDGVRWSRGFKKGRHVFEIIFPIHLRGKHAWVGLGTLDTPMKADSVARQTIGQSTNSWGIDLVTRKTLHGGKVFRRFPYWNQVLPDWFFMYIDLDDGMLHFGSDSEYYGTAFINVIVNEEPLYPMVTTSELGAIVGIVYRGEGKEVTGPLRKKR